MSAEGKSISIIIPTFNSEDTIRDCLESICAQTQNSAEVIVADGSSEDSTVLIANELADVICTDAGTRSHARNIALARATGDYILALDSDMKLGSPSLLADCVRVMKGGAIAVLLPEWSEGRNFWSRALAFERNLGFHLQEVHGNGVPRLFRTADVRRVGGWRENLTWGEDYDLYSRICPRSNVTITSGHVVHLETAKSPISVLKKWYFYGKTKSKFNDLHGNIVDMAQVRATVSILLSPATAEAIVSHPLLASGGLMLKLMRQMAVLYGSIR